MSEMCKYLLPLKIQLFLLLLQSLYLYELLLLCGMVPHSLQRVAIHKIIELARNPKYQTVTHEGQLI